MKTVSVSTELDAAIQAVSFGFARMLRTLRPSVEGRGYVWSTERQHAQARFECAAMALVCLLDARAARLTESKLPATLIAAMLRSPWLRAHAPRVPGVAPDYVYATTAEEIMFDLLWGSLAYPTFALTPDLAASLLLSDPAQVDEADVPWPFPAFRVVVPRELGLTLTVSETLPVMDLRITFRSLLFAATAASGVVVPQGTVAALEGAKDADAFRGALRLLVDRALETATTSVCTSVLVARLYDVCGRSVHHVSSWAGRGTTCAAWLDTKAQAAVVQGVDAEGSRVIEDVAETSHTAMRAAERLALNLALYLNSRDATSRERVWDAARPTPSASHRLWTLGRSVRVSPEVFAAARAVTRGATPSDIRVRHIVRGHFKRAGADRHQIYVAPYWRGPRDGPTPDRLYEVK